MAAAHDFEALLSRIGARIASADALGGPGSASSRHALGLSWPALDAVLPDGGLPAGVVELSAPRALGGSTSVALAAMRAGQARGSAAWCAWIDPEKTLHGPGVAAAGVDLDRMLVVRPPRAQLPRVAVKVVASAAFEVVAIDVDAVPKARGVFAGPRERTGGGTRRPWPPEVLVRKLALAAESSGTTVLLLTDGTRPRAMPWPVALRVELSRPRPGDLCVRVAKDKRGRVGALRTIPFLPPSLHALHATV
ncbi:MAG TPA: recombinase A [Polyangiaceae bacterium]|jgi:recombination protein RecA